MHVSAPPQVVTLDEAEGGLIELEDHEVVSAIDDVVTPIEEPLKERLFSGYPLWMLALVVHAGFGLFFCYESIPALTPNFTEELGFTSTQMGMLYAAYSIPSLATTLFGGLLADTIGVAKTLLIFTNVQFLGTAIIATSSNFMIIFIGQIIYGVGGTNIYSNINVLLGQWFGTEGSAKKKLGIAFGLTAAWYRSASFLAFMITPRIASSKGLRVSLGVAALFALTSALSATAFFGLDRRRRIRRPRTESKKTLKDALMMFSVMKDLPLVFWIIAIIQAIFTTNLYIFTSNATEWIKSKWGYSAIDAATITSLVCLANMLTAPLAGYVAGRYGQRVHLVIIGAATMLIVNVLFGTTYLHPAIFTSILGIVQSIMDTSLLPSVSLVVDEELYGRAYGFVVFIWNVGLFLLPIVIGSILDSTNGDVAKANNCFIVLSVVAFMSSLFLMVVNKRRHHNLLNKASE